MTKVMEKEREMIPKIILKLEKGSKVRKDPPYPSSKHLLSFPKERGTPPLHVNMEKDKS
jgi:hypothetical protein